MKLKYSDHRTYVFEDYRQVARFMFRLRVGCIKFDIEYAGELIYSSIKTFKEDTGDFILEKFRDIEKDPMKEIVWFFGRTNKKKLHRSNRVVRSSGPSIFLKDDIPYIAEVKIE
jgi:hypothetical protein